MTACSMPNLTSLGTVESKSVLPKGWKADLTDLASLDLTLPVMELIRRTTSRLPQDIIEAVVANRNLEAEGSRAANTLDTMIENITLADDHVSPLCQDTGTIIFWVRHPFGLSQRKVKEQIRRAVADATAQSWLRPNCVESLSGRNPGNNMDPFLEGHPVIHFEEREEPGVEVSIMLKGGGCENVGAQYRLPEASLGAGRDLGGVRKCVIDAVTKAQGQGCSPGILGVAIGGDRVTGYERSKEVILRKLGTPNPDPRLDAFERKLTEEINTLGIGPMGYGGRTTVLGVLVSEMFRHPASFFVSISYMCWSSRRMDLVVDETGSALYR
ncbi:fumarate hydratase [Geothrix sp. 21YS21S-2]|uniref:fumarate hydratase n=1 Tax=Geothrix sp. 21YS21S-2 TaxID=3068893 RepID=UPI0027BAAF02|nr:fumarate hydratase [Geothrix sp. 21YS21S-2]